MEKRNREMASRSPWKRERDGQQVAVEKRWPAGRRGEERWPAGRRGEERWPAGRRGEERWPAGRLGNERKRDGQQVAVEKRDGQQVAVEKRDGQLTRTWRRVLESAGFRVSRFKITLLSHQRNQIRG